VLPDPRGARLRAARAVAAVHGVTHQHLGGRSRGTRLELETIQQQGGDSANRDHQQRQQAQQAVVLGAAGRGGGGTCAGGWGWRSRRAFLGPPPQIGGQIRLLFTFYYCTIGFLDRSLVIIVVVMSLRGLSYRSAARSPPADVGAEARRRPARRVRSRSAGCANVLPI
jgi:hypothetical protein